MLQLILRVSLSGLINAVIVTPTADFPCCSVGKMCLLRDEIGAKAFLLLETRVVLCCVLSLESHWSLARL